MDVTFICPTCKQDLEADASLAGTTIQCPSCGAGITIPVPDPQNVKVVNPIAASAGAKIDKHFAVPVHEGPAESLIVKPPPPLEVTAKDTDKKIRVRSIRRIDCVEVGHDRFDEVVTEFLGRIGEENVVSINTMAYTHLDIGSQKLLTDYGVLIVYRG
jgi:DNA-directed RNA polymerase subunit RPC12/RpoP